MGGDRDLAGLKFALDSSEAFGVEIWLLVILETAASWEIRCLG